MRLFVRTWRCWVMVSDWKLSTLEEAGVVLIDCVHKTPPATDQGYPYIGIPQIKNGCIDFSLNPRLISYSDYKKWTIKADPKADDIVLSRRCNPGETAYVPQGVEFALGQNLVLLRSVGHKIYPPFLRWLVRGPEWWAQVGKYLNVGAVFDSLRCGEIPRFELLIPPLSEQKAIAHILGCLDDKIELNRQMNETLEAMAQALFKSWFVDFDPVIDNALAAGNAIPDELLERAEQRKGIDKKDSSDIQGLFPDEFEFTEEMGWIPKGWEVESFGDVSMCFDRLRVPLSKRERESKKPGVIPYHGATSVMDYINEWIFDDIYLLIGEDGSVIKEDGSPFVQYIWGKTWVNNHAHVLQGKNGVSTEHLMLFMQSQNLTAYITGAVQLKINQGNMNRIPFLNAGSKINEKFEAIVNPFYEQLRNIAEENENLVKIRDTLLPKLMSGELRILDVDTLIEDM